MDNVATRTLPPHYRREVCDPLRKLLDKACKMFRVDQAFIGYVEEEDVVSIDPGLWVGRPNFPVLVLGKTEGLCGLAIREKAIYAYPLDPEAKAAIVLLEKIRTIGEMAGPLRYRNDVTGVVLLHSSDPSCQFDAASKTAFGKILNEMSSKIRSVDKTRADARRALTRIAEDCLDQVDNTDRGYIAVKNWDGSLDYFHESNYPNPFLPFDQWEGLCGQVMYSGKPILASNVFDYAAYRASDPDIRSEIVYPIYDDQETIGVVNLESMSEGAFENAEDTVKKAADRAQQWAVKFRQPPSDDFGYVLSDYFGSVAALVEFEFREAVEAPENHVDKQIIELLQRKALTAVGGIRSAWWPKTETPPFASGRSEPSDAPGVLNGGFDTGDGFFTIPAEVTISGSPYGTIAIEKEATYRAEDPHILKTFCRITAFFLQYWRRAGRLRSFIQLLQRLTLRPDASLLEETIHRVPRIVGGESCTLFYKTTILGREVFVPGPATTTEVFRAQSMQDGDPWYEAGPGEGLTAWVGSTARPLLVNDIRDTAQLKRIDPDLTWKRLLPEEGESRSFLACPVFRPGLSETPENVIGVLRTHRAENSRQSGFSEHDLATFETIARLLAAPLYDVITADAPLQGVNVEMAQPAGGITVRGTSDGNGRIDLGVLPAGSYCMRLTMGETCSARVEIIGAGRTIRKQWDFTASAEYVSDATATAASDVPQITIAVDGKHPIHLTVVRTEWVGLDS